MRIDDHLPKLLREDATGSIYQCEICKIKLYHTNME